MELLGSEAKTMEEDIVMDAEPSQIEKEKSETADEPKPSESVATEKVAATPVPEESICPVNRKPCFLSWKECLLVHRDDLPFE